MKILLQLSLGVLLLTAGAQILVPMVPVPMTLQTLALCILVFFPGRWAAFWATFLYVGLGVLGLPVFADWTALPGSAFLAGKSSGYLLGFLPAAVFMGGVLKRKTSAGFGLTLTVFLIGHALILTFGTTWLARHIGLSDAVEFGLRPFLIGALVKSIAAATAGQMCRRLLQS